MTCGDSEQPERNADKGQRRTVMSIAFTDVLWFFLDVWFIWPQSHVAALWVFFGFVAIQLAFAFPIASSRYRYAIGVLLLAALIQPFLPPVPKPETETHFWLVPAGDPLTSDNPCAEWVSKGAVPSDAIFLFVGPIVYWIGHDETVHDRVLISIRTRPLLSFSREGGQISISGDLFDQAGNVVANINHNEVHLVPGEYAYAERSESDPSTVKIIGRRKEELLYFRFANPTTIRLRGRFPIPNSPPGTPLATITDSEIQMDGLHFGSTCTHSNNETGTFDLEG
jgi:hypothetical protein